MLIAWIPSLTLLGAWSGWRKLARLYPAQFQRDGRRFRCGMVMRLAHYRSGTRLTAGTSHLHFSVVPPFRPGHSPFSVPWADVAVSRDEWPWLPFKGLPAMRITLAKDPKRRILVSVPVGEGIVAASAGRIQLTQPGAPALAAR